MWRLPRTSGSGVLPVPHTALFLTVAFSLRHLAPTQVPAASSPGLLPESSLAEDSIFDYSITRPLHPLMVSVFNYVRDATRVGRLNHSSALSCLGEPDSSSQTQLTTAVRDANQSKSSNNNEYKSEAVRGSEELSSVMNH